MSRPHNNEEALLRINVWKEGKRGIEEHTDDPPLLLETSSETYFPL